MPALSILIPARNEQFLAKTVEDILSNAEGDIEILVCLDGAWAEPPIQDHPRVHLIHHSVSIGQRAATNEAARLAQGKYVMKVDAHCAFDKGFDVKLLADMQDDWTVVPVMRNLWVFDWVCKKCGDRRYQGPTPTSCPKCNNTTDFEMDVVWIAKPSPQSKSYCFDSTPRFQYFREFNKRPEGQGDITETMSLQGSCFLMTREKFFELGVCDESFGSWGSMGIEIALRTWLSGGRVVCNQKTFYSHLFRTQGAGFSFPYTLPGSQVEHAKNMVRDLFFNNKWERQIYPLSWLIERFKPVPGWHDESGKVALAQIISAGIEFERHRASSALTLGGTDSTDSHRLGLLEVAGGGQEISSRTMSLGSVDRGDGIATTQVLNLQSQSDMEGITTGLIITSDVIENRDSSSIAHRDRFDKPSVDQSMDSEYLVMSDSFSKSDESNLSIPVFVESTSPNPALTQRVVGVNLNPRKETSDGIAVESGNCEIIEVSHDSASVAELRLGSGRASSRPDPIIPQKGIVFYTDNRLDSHILNAVQNQIKQSVNGLDIVSVSLKPIDFGRNIVLDKERGVLTMFEQILAGLEASTADIIFFVEHDVLYHESHFQFVPSRKDVFYYNTNVYKVRQEDGLAVRVDFCQQTSGLCAYRELLLEHYRKRVERVKREGHSRNTGFEPGSHSFPRGIDNYRAESWESLYPILDIRHDKNLTPSRWSPTQFRNPKFAKGWREASEIEGWGKTTDILEMVKNGRELLPLG